ncbi:Reverse transcriptase [Phytophthora palmivora]|uniref:Reverse transcriptase n=1 Tax=Phytophthora palmivora TaxID=4796 RepID=A0A2P4XPG4_9STRA|nr:Reverse transcriptase [Phytophthora palmivora]
MFVHSCTEDSETAMGVHFKHIRRAFEVMRANKLYVNIDNEGDKDPRLVCQQGRRTRRSRECHSHCSLADAKATSESGANYLPKYSAGYAKRAGPLLDLLKKDHQDAFDSTKASSQHAPVLDLPDENKSFSVVCDFSDYAIGCALLQKDDEGRERVISFQFRQQKAAERNYPVHDKVLLAMKYALVKFRVHLLGPRPFVITQITRPCGLPPTRRTYRMARWLSFFAEYNFRVEYKPGKLNVLADGLSRRPGYGLPHIRGDMTGLYDRIRLDYQGTRTTHHWCGSCPKARAKSIGSRLDSGHGVIAMNWPMGYSAIE